MNKQIVKFDYEIQDSGGFNFLKSQIHIGSSHCIGIEDDPTMLGTMFLEMTSVANALSITESMPTLDFNVCELSTGLSLSGSEEQHEHWNNVISEYEPKRIIPIIPNCSTFDGFKGFVFESSKMDYYFLLDVSFRDFFGLFPVDLNTFYSSIDDFLKTVRTSYPEVAETED